MNEQKQASVNPWEGAEVINAYTRAQALADGVLVDLTLCRARHKVSNAVGRIMLSRDRPAEVRRRERRRGSCFCSA